MNRGPGRGTPSQTRRRRDRERTRERFVECAAREFRNRPYHSVTIEQIADQAGYSKRAIYLYFADKQLLFQEVLSREITEWNEHLKPAEHLHKTALPQLEAILIACSEYLWGHSELRRHLLEHFALNAPGVTGKEGAGDPGDRVRGAMTEVLRTMTRCLDRGTIDGTVSAEVDPEAEAGRIVNEILAAAVIPRISVQTNQSELSTKQASSVAARLCARLKPLGGS